eukprot:6910994-Pyramimonas_sp.AAC.1
MVSSPAVGSPFSCDSRVSSHSSRWRRLTVAESVGIRGGWVFPGVVSPVGCVGQSARCSLSSPCPFSCCSRPTSHSSQCRWLTIAESRGIRGGWVFAGVVLPVGCVGWSARLS